MCGIIGYIGKTPEKVLFDGLKKLEYRGYDCAGMTTVRDRKFTTYKSIGKVDTLKEKLIFNDNLGVGIAHTRWATHGKVSLENCHPHFNNDFSICLVHNGIIENFNSLKEQLIKKGKSFYGETDSEVIAKMFEHGLTIKKVKSVVDNLAGSYALLMLDKTCNDIYFAKNKNPLYIAFDDEKVMLTSDSSCFNDIFDSFITLEDGQYGKVSLKTVEIYQNDKKIDRPKVTKCFKSKAIGLGKYSHFMLKEIGETKSVLRKAIKFYNARGIKNIFKNLPCGFEKVVLIGCGSAYNAGLLAKGYFIDAGLNSECILASEIEFESHNINEKSLCIFISQSGETQDTLKAMNFCMERKAYCLSLTNVVHSSIARKSHFNIDLLAGCERAVASTKAYTAQVFHLYILAFLLKNRNSQIENLAKEICKYINFDSIEVKNIEYLAKKHLKSRLLFFIGKGRDSILAREGALKLKEISYLPAFDLPSGELKHGSIALIDKFAICIAICSQEKTLSKIASSAEEIRARGGMVILFSSVDARRLEDCFDDVLYLKSSGKFDIVNLIIAMQKFAYFVAIKRGCNPDMPRNLAKSVTVE